MPDGLYDQDILAWSTHQADLLRRLGRGERVNDVDWDNIAEEIEDVGLSQLHAVESLLTQLIEHLLKLPAWPTNDARNHWRKEVVTFQRTAKRRFAPSMRQRIDLPGLYGDALDAMTAGLDDPVAAGVWPDANPFTLDDLLSAPIDQLLERLTRS